MLQNLRIAVATICVPSRDIENDLVSTPIEDRIASSSLMSLVIRCGTPDCDWGHKLSEFSDDQLKLCYSEF